MTRRAGRHVGEHFDEVAPSWIRRYADRPSFRHRLAVVSEVVREVAAGYDQPAVLDFGGGPGVFSLVASGTAESVLCLDVSATMVRAGFAHQADAVALVRAAGHEPVPGRVRRVVGPLEALREPANGVFDVILAVAVLEYLPDPEGLLTALAARLRPGGRLVMTVPNERSWYRRIENMAGALGAGVGSALGLERLRSRAYASARPHGNRVSWRGGADAGNLLLERLSPLALAGAGALARVNATHIVVLGKRC